MNIFGVFTCSSLVILGRMADIWGRKKIFLLGLGFYCISFLGSGFATHPGAIIFFQVFAGLGNATLLTVSQTMLIHLYPEKQRSKALGLWGAVLGFSFSLGPLLSGILVTNLSWRAVFFVPLAAVILSIVLVSFFAQDSKNTEDNTSLDWPGALLLATSIGAFTLAVTEHSLPARFLIMLYAISLCALVLLIIVEKRTETPILRIDLLSKRRFVLASFINAVMTFLIWANFFLIPLFLQTEAHFTILDAGLLLLFITIPYAILSPIVGKLYQTIDVKYLLIIGCLILIASTIAQLLFTPQSHWFTFVFAALLLGIGWGFVWGPSTTAATELLSKARAGIAVGTFLTTQEIGGTLGLVITVSVVRTQKNFTAGFHHGVFVLMAVSILALIAALFIRLIKVKA